MTLLSLALFATTILPAQSIVPVAPATVVRGSSFTLSINLAGATAAGPVAAQWTLVLPIGWTAATPVSAVTGKTISCNAPALICLLYHVTGNTVMVDGRLATLYITVPPTAATGPMTISTTATMGVAVSGATMVTVGGPATINVAPGTTQVLLLESGKMVIADLDPALTLDTSVPSKPVLRMAGGMTFVESVAQLTAPQSTFDLADVPRPGSLEVFRNGLLLSEAVDYTLTGKRVVLLAAAESGDVMRLRWVR